MKKLNVFTALISAVLFMSSVSLVSCKHDKGISDPAEVTVTGITVSCDSDYTVGDKLTADDFVVKATMSDGTKKTVASSEVTVEVPSTNLDADGNLARSEGSEGESENVNVKVSYAGFSKNVTITINNPIIPFDTENAFKSYLVGGDETNRVIAEFQDWGSGTTYTTTFNDEEAEDFALSVEMASGNSWGFDTIYLSYKLLKGYINRYSHVVLTADISNFTFGENQNTNILLSGGGTDNLYDVSKYGTENADGTVTYVVPLADFPTDDGVSNVTTSNQISMVLKGTGSATVSEFYLAVAEQGAVDKIAAEDAVSAAEEAVAEYVVGEEVGNYPAEAKAAFDYIIEAAKAVLAAEDATQEDVDTLVEIIAEAKKALDESKIVDTASIPTALAVITNTPTTVLYSAADGVAAIGTWSQSWGGGCTPEDYEVTPSKKVKLLKNCSGWFGLTDFAANTVAAASTGKHTILHFDVFTNTNVTNKAVLGDGKGEFEGSTTGISEYGWHGVDIDLTAINAAGGSLVQIGWGTAGNFYIDNIYLYEETQASLTINADNEVEVGKTLTLKAVDATGNDVTAGTTFTVVSGTSTIDGAVLTAAATVETVTVKAVYNGQEVTKTISVVPVNPGKFFTTAGNGTGALAGTNPGLVCLWSNGTISSASISEDAKEYTVNVAAQSGDWWSTQIFYHPVVKSNISFKFKTNKDCDITVVGQKKEMVANVEQEYSITGLPPEGEIAIQLGVNGEGNVGAVTFTISDFTVTPVVQ